MKSEIENEIITLRERILEREEAAFKKQAARLICKTFKNVLPLVVPEPVKHEK